MASNLFVKRDCAVRFRLRSAAALATSAKREVPRANGRVAAGSAAVFCVASCFLENTVSADGLYCFPVAYGTVMTDAMRPSFVYALFGFVESVSASIPE